MENYLNKLSSNNFSMLLVIKVLIRVLWFSILIWFFKFNIIEHSNELEVSYRNLSLLFYFISLYVLDRYLKYSTTNNLEVEIMIESNFTKIVKFFSWVILAFIILLITLLIVDNLNIWQNGLFKSTSNSLRNVFSGHAGFIYFIIIIFFINRLIKKSVSTVSNHKEITDSKEDYNFQLEKLLKYFKWVFLIFTLGLMLLTLLNTAIAWPHGIVKTLFYLITDIMPSIFATNISFIIICMLMFYASSILNVNNRLQQEQDLTI